MVKGPVSLFAQSGAQMWFVLAHRGQEEDVIRKSKSKCTGRFPKSYPAYDQRLFELSGFTTVSDRQITFARKLGGAQLARMLAAFKGRVAALASCTYEPYYSRNLCGKTFRGALRLVSPEGRAVAARPFAVTWKAREC